MSEQTSRSCGARERGPVLHPSGVGEPGPEKSERETDTGNRVSFAHGGAE
jgi:hypothetical protein